MVDLPAEPSPGRRPQPAALSRRLLGAGIWSVAELGLGQVLRLASNLIMTRLLLPEAFGVMAMVVTLHVALALLTDMSVHRSVVQAPGGAEPRFLRVAWAVQVLRGAVMAAVVVLAGGLLWLLAPQFAPQGSVYADPALPGLIAVSALVVLMGGFGSTNQYLAERNLQAGRNVILALSSQVVSVVAMIALATLWASVWALLWGMMIGSAFRMLLSHLVFHGPRMAFEWDPAIVDELWQFGKWLLGSSACTFVARNADRLILAALLSATDFGFYVIALMWVQGVSQVPGMLTGRLGFPAFSEVARARPAETARVFRRFSRLIDGLCLAGFLLFLLGGGLLIGLLYPPGYATAAGFMPFLALAILCERYGTLGFLLLSRGDSKALLMNSALTAAAICLALPLGFRWLGTEGALLATALSPLAGAVPLMLRAAPVLGRRTGTEWLWFAAIFAAAAGVYGLAVPIPPAAA